MRSTLPAFLVLLGSIGHADWAGAQNGPNDAMAWLKKIASASRQINYAGTFVYQHGNQVETSHIAHWADASGEYEKLETRSTDRRVRLCAIMTTSPVIFGKQDGRHRKRTARQFPALLPSSFPAFPIITL
jgi:sigma-E factor negative regulatory protein RseB